VNLFADVKYLLEGGYLALSYGDNGDPQGDPYEPGCLLYRISHETVDQVCLTMKMRFF
jgi:hypothetical protein